MTTFEHPMDLMDEWNELFELQASEIDPDDEELWSSLLLGWLLGMGVEPADARDIVDVAPKNGWLI